MLLLVLVALVVALSVLYVDRRIGTRPSSLSGQGRRGWIVLGMVALLPFAHAVGTANPLPLLAVDAFAAWAALIIAVLTGIESVPRAARFLVGAVAVSAVAASTLIATDAMWSHPYRTTGRNRTSAAIEGVPALKGLRLEPASARAYGLLYRRLKPYNQPTGRAMIAYDKLPGVVLILGGRPVGEAWNSSRYPDRAAAGIRAECTTGHPWWGRRLPILILRRPLPDVMTAALRECGLDFTNGYRLLTPIGQTEGPSVYVPR
jgi:hypothetical protein